MSPKDFKETAQLLMIKEFKNKLISLQKNYNEIKDQFDDLCDELDKSMSDQQTQ